MALDTKALERGMTARTARKSGNPRGFLYKAQRHAFLESSGEQKRVPRLVRYSASSEPGWSQHSPQFKDAQRSSRGGPGLLPFSTVCAPP